MPIEVDGKHGLLYAMLTKDDFTEGEVGMDCRDATLDAGGGFTPTVEERVGKNGLPLVDRKGKPVGYRSHRWCPQTFREIELNAKLSSRHGQTPYMVVADIVESMFPKQTISCHMIEEGKKMMWIIKTDKSHTFEDGDSVHQYLMVTSSLDSSWKTAIRGYMHRPNCSNQFKFGTMVFESKNTVNNSLRFATWAISERQQKFADEWDTFIDEAWTLKQIELPATQHVRTLSRIIPEPVRRPGQTDQGYRSMYTRWENQIDAIIVHYKHEVASYGRNMWSLLQAIQSYELHDKCKNKSEDDRLMHKHDVVAGDKQPLTDKAFKVLVHAV